MLLLLLFFTTFLSLFHKSTRLKRNAPVGIPVSIGALILKSIGLLEENACHRGRLFRCGDFFTILSLSTVVDKRRCFPDVIILLSGVLGDERMKANVLLNTLLHSGHMSVVGQYFLPDPHNLVPFHYLNMIYLKKFG